MYILAVYVFICVAAHEGCATPRATDGVKKIVKRIRDAVNSIGESWGRENERDSALSFSVTRGFFCLASGDATRRSDILYIEHSTPSRISHSPKATGVFIFFGNSLNTIFFTLLRSSGLETQYWQGITNDFLEGLIFAMSPECWQSRGPIFASKLLPEVLKNHSKM